MLEIRQAVRTTAGQVLCSDELSKDETEAAAGTLCANPAPGNLHVVRCGSCRDTRTLFRDENDGPFRLTALGWRCETCSTAAASQEVRF